jgi:hypothetical protein
MYYNNIDNSSGADTLQSAVQAGETRRMERAADVLLPAGQSVEEVGTIFVSMYLINSILPMGKVRN